MQGKRFMKEGLLISDTEVSPMLYRRYFFNIAQGIANTFLRTYRMLYRSAILFLIKNPIFIRYFFIKNIFFRLDSFFDFDIRVWCQPLPGGRFLLRRDAM